MSGHKRATISLSEREYMKLHEAEMRKRFLNEESQEYLGQVEKEFATQLTREVKGMRKRQDDLADLFTQVNQEIGRFEDQASQAMIEQHQVMARELSQAVEDQQTDTYVALENLTLHMQAQLQEVLESHRRDRSWLESEWQRQADGQSDKFTLAKEWIQSASTLEQFIYEHYDHDHLTPGKTQLIATRLEQAQENLDHGMFEAALTSAQEAYNQFSDLRISLEKLHCEHQLLKHQVDLRSQTLWQLIQNNKIVPAIDLEGSELPFTIDVDFWTGGKLTDLEREFGEVLGEFQENALKVDKHRLEQLIKEYFPCVEEKVKEYTFNARLKVLKAQLRVNIADIVVHALASQGYFLENSSFLRGDERKSYEANLTNYEGCKVVVKIDPGQDRLTSNELNLFSIDSQTKTAHELRQRTKEIFQAIQGQGLNVGTIRVSPGLSLSQGFAPESQRTPNTRIRQSRKNLRQITHKKIPS